MDSEEELAKIRDNLNKANIRSAEQDNAACCYASANKQWTLDPQGTVWEAFHKTGDIPIFGDDNQNQAEGEPSAYCIPIQTIKM